jgi:hypothetical protein
MQTVKTESELMREIIANSLLLNAALEGKSVSARIAALLYAIGSYAGAAVDPLADDQFIEHATAMIRQRMQVVRDGQAELLRQVQPAGAA